ncbi:hypothetical protein NQ315_003106 [Exocentrus adspersus]|uniref:Aminopeptidase n=1 Tax=Exocentrus adspersus TaxID=1586481 RepID=A0AAV8W498_9CUCU|nr:hypothetical protein NQ315_003106 [Exocentrus adspersus]
MELTLFSILICFAALKVAVPQTVPGEEYRLPDLYTPISYHIHINVPNNSIMGDATDFSGRVQIQLSFKNVTNFIALHAHHDFIIVDKVTFNSTEVGTTNYAINNVTDILRVNTTSEVVAGVAYTLEIEYTGVLSTGDMNGFYKSSYMDDSGTTKYLATTFFSPVHARRAFPCFDEPALKATFNFSFTVPWGLEVLFNTQQKSMEMNVTSGITTSTFGTTPVMSTFVLAFIVSDLSCSFGTISGTVPCRVCSRSGTETLRYLALDYGGPILDSLNNFTNYAYGDVMEKMDQVAVPDLSPNAMENWGLITYRENALLWNGNQSSNRNKQRVITVMAHELAHQWFGNLVTQYWWAAVFLKEGFATYFEYHTPHEIFPDWELDKQFLIDKMHPVLQSDALETTQALQSDCYTPAEVTARFNTISYNKGSSILRMVQHFMGYERFKTGIQNYVANHRFGYVEPEHLWQSLSSSVLDSITSLPATFTTVMEDWVRKPGYPVLQVTVTGNNVTITQKRFLYSGEDNATSWYVPISYSLSLDQDKFGRTSPIVWLTPNNSLSFILPNNCDWIILNNQQSAYYRVNYDDGLWTSISIALQKENFDGITEVNRAQIVDDLFNLARADYFKYSRVLNILRFLSNDTSYYSWSTAVSGFNFLLIRVGEGTFLGNAISATVLELLSKLYDSVPVTNLNDTDQIYTHKQVLALTWSCRLGNEDCIQEMQALFNQYKSSGVRPDKNLRSIVYCNALRYSNTSEDWDFLWEVYTSSDLATELVTIISALGCTRNESIQRRYLNLSITEGSGIRTQDALSVFSSVYSGSARGVDITFDFLVENYEAIAARYNSMNSVGNLIRGIAERFTEEFQVSKLKDFIETENLPEPFRIAANEALETAETNIKWLDNFQGDLVEFFSSGATKKIKKL